MKDDQINSDLEECSSCSEARGSVISRRKFLGRGALAVGAAGATVAATGGLGLLTNSFAGATTPPPTCATVPGTLKHPRGTWGYPSTGLDVGVCAERAYHSFRVGHCAYAVIDGVIGTLQDVLGSPYTNVDQSAFIFMWGGIMGWGTVCGTAAGGGICTNIIAGKDGTHDRGMEMSDDIMGYYSQTALPLYVPITNDYTGTDPRFQPGGTIPQVVPDSPLCHVSVGKWMTAAGITGFWSAERTERCARVSGTIAGKTAELLNAWNSGTYAPAGFHSSGMGTAGRPAQYDCSDCHTPGSV